MALRYIQSQIRELGHEADRTESQIESLSSVNAGKRRGKKEERKKGEKEVCVRMVNYESLESKRVMEVLKNPLEMYVDALVDPHYDGGTDHLETLDPEDAHEELNMLALSAQIGGLQVGPLDEEKENGHDNGSANEGSGDDDGNSRTSGGSRHRSQDTLASPAPRKTVAAASPVTSAKLAKFVLY